MLFKKEWVDDVLSGRKRQTVRLRQPRLQVGRSYAVQTSYRSRGLGRIRITAIRRSTLRDLTKDDLAAEGWGGRSREAFERYFAQVNHLRPERMTAREWKALRARPLWYIDFEPAPDGERPAASG